MHKCNENMNAMLVLKFSKHKNVFFQIVFDFYDFSKALKIWDGNKKQIFKNMPWKIGKHSIQIFILKLFHK